MAVVQPTGTADIDVPDLAELYPDAQPIVDGHSGDWGHDANGSVHFADESRAGTVLREGGSISLGNGRGFRVLMCEPVQQGLITRDTRVVLADRPKHVPEEDDDGAGSIAPSHRSLVDEFDPDAFLASSLARSLSQLTDEENPTGPMDVRSDTDTSLTNSGSLTPRPGERIPSPVAAPDDVLQIESPDEGMRFVAIPAAGRQPMDDDDNDVCYAGVWALGRAGVFEGDWVQLRAVQDGEPGRTRLARVVAWEMLDEESDL